MSNRKSWGDSEAFLDRREQELNGFSEEGRENQHKLNEELHVELDKETNEGTDKPKRKKKAIDTKTKLDAAKMACEVSVHAAARFYKIDRACVQRYVKQTVELSKMHDKRKRLDGGGRVLTSKEIDEALAQWILEKRSEKKRVTRRMIWNEAANRFADAEISFKRSHGWMESFLKRHQFSLRAATTTCQKLPSEFEKILVNHFLNVNKKIEESTFKHIFACDETAVWLDSSTSKCVDSIGVREVGVLTRGYDKMNISVMLTARSDGVKLRPFVVVPRKLIEKKIEAKFQRKLLLCWKEKKNKCFDNDITTEYLQRSFGGLGFFNKQERSLLIWDQHSAHKSESTKECLHKLKLDCIYVPGGTTKFAQPADVAWNAPFKAYIRQQYEDWILNSAPDLTRPRKDGSGGGNPKAPSMDTYLTWIVQAWDKLSKEMIQKSFKGCGIGIAANGDEDNMIQCFKADGAIPNGLKLLGDARMKKEIDGLLAPLQSTGIWEFREVNDPEAENDEFIDSDVSICSDN